MDRQFFFDVYYMYISNKTSSRYARLEVRVSSTTLVKNSWSRGKLTGILFLWNCESLTFGIKVVFDFEITFQSLHLFLFIFQLVQPWMKLSQANHFSNCLHIIQNSVDSQIDGNSEERPDPTCSNIFLEFPPILLLVHLFSAGMWRIRSGIL